MTHFQTALYLHIIYMQFDFTVGASYSQTGQSPSLLGIEIFKICNVDLESYLTDINVNKQQKL